MNKFAHTFGHATGLISITAEAFREIGKRVRNGGATEYDIQQWIMQAFLREGLTTAGDKPVVAVNEHSSIPHYSPTPEHSAPIHKGDFVLLDIWAKENTPGGGWNREFTCQNSASE